MNDRTGMLLVGHGTRDAAGQAEFLQTADLVAARLPEVCFQPCFLELTPPAIDQAVQRLLASGVQRIVVSPLLLFAAGHAKRDIPDAVRRALAGRPGVAVLQAEHLGVHPRLVELSHRRFLDAAAAAAAVPHDAPLLLMVGRGSHDVSAADEMRLFAHTRGQRSGIAHLRTAFFAMARPSVDEAIAEIRRLPVRQVVVQPHLLFAGRILSRLRSQVAEADGAAAGQSWHITPHLGVSDLVADAVAERFMQALSRQAV